MTTLESLKENKVATEEEAKQALDNLIEWVCEHNWKYDECPTVYNCLVPLESFLNTTPKDKVVGLWRNFFGDD